MKPKTVTLVCDAPQAGSVFVAGTFNDWSTTVTPLHRSPSGLWKTTLRLPAGTYEYKFVVDGAWCCVPGAADDMTPPCEDCVPNTLGTLNRLVVVK